jgi:hypothetical protein
MASRAIPSHLKPSAAAGGQGEGEFTQRHHGKSQSHVVSTPVYPSTATPIISVLSFMLAATVLHCPLAINVGISTKEEGGRPDEERAPQLLHTPHNPG